MWFKVDDGFAFHSKTLAAGNTAVGLWVRAGSWAAQHQAQDVPPDILRQLGPNRQAQSLIDTGLLVAGAEGHRIGHGTEARFPLWGWDRSDYRRKIPARVRELVYRRDGHTCVDCGSTEDLTLDHIYPWSLGGSDHQSNLRTLCRTCNARKGIQLI